MPKVRSLVSYKRCEEEVSARRPHAPQAKGKPSSLQDVHKQKGCAELIYIGLIMCYDSDYMEHNASPVCSDKHQLEQNQNYPLPQECVTCESLACL